MTFKTDMEARQYALSASRCIGFVRKFAKAILLQLLGRNHLYQSANAVYQSGTFSYQLIKSSKEFTVNLVNSALLKATDFVVCKRQRH